MGTAQRRDHEGSGVHRLFKRLNSYVVFGVLVSGVLASMGAHALSVRDRLVTVESRLDDSRKVDRYLMLQVRYTNNIIGKIVPASRRHEIPDPPPGLEAAEMELLSE